MGFLCVVLIVCLFIWVIRGVEIGGRGGKWWRKGSEDDIMGVVELVLIMG